MSYQCKIVAIFSPSIKIETPEQQQNHRFEFEIRINVTVQEFFAKLSQKSHISPEKLQVRWNDAKGEEHYIDLENDDPKKKLSDYLPQHYLRDSGNFTIILK